jgi:preprotein translocase subunit SecD
MLKKWYISTFIIILTLLGAVSQQQTVIPNQEIVLQFTDAEVTPEEVKNTIAIVKQQLQDLGVNNIQVKESEHGKLKITYYSDSDVASIKETFSKEDKLKVDFNSHNQNESSNKFPIDGNTISYNLDVYEIHNGNDIEWNLNGLSVVEFDTKNDRFFDPNSSFYFNPIEVSEDNSIKLTYKVRKNIALAIDDILHKIPEVRAGPVS